ncbi:hypothetical protein BBK14_24325 [Parafrankia soli]|uniref:Uncharacterized protein n=1 Tax=Parafrankia soli TaxID=2599596 RepID=A0A1S1PPT0_9ACTN|nr:hypothetical protein [Parafrankia soli]OHV23251.1 hypothetical protein BBK14_24325 [Parafrankia soli]
MSEYVDPKALHSGDVVSPLFNPQFRIVVDHIGLSTLGKALPKHNPDLPPSTPVRLIFGTEERFGTPDRILIDPADQVRRHRRADTR